jgi:hypothetical protein
MMGKTTVSIYYDRDADLYRVSYDGCEFTGYLHDSLALSDPTTSLDIIETMLVNDFRSKLSVALGDAFNGRVNADL